MALPDTRFQTIHQDDLGELYVAVAERVSLIYTIQVDQVVINDVVDAFRRPRSVGVKLS